MFKIGETVVYSGRFGNESDPDNFGRPIKGQGKIVGISDSHGLCLLIEDATGQRIWVDPDETVNVKDV